MSIDRFIAENDPFRMVYPSEPLPLPLPTRTKYNYDDFESLFRTLDSQIFGIVLSRKIRVVPAPLASVQWRFDEASCRKVITIPTNNTDTTEWSAAAKEIFDLFKTHDPHTEVQVEVCNQRKTYYRRILDMLPSESDRTYFHSVYGDLLSAACQYLSTNWHDLGLYMCESDEEKSPKPTCIVHVKDNSVCDWNQAISAFESILDRPFKVLFQPGKLVPVASAPWIGRIGTPVNGDSIRTVDHGHLRYQTIGIFANARKLGNGPDINGLQLGDNACVITCYHGVAPLHSPELWHTTWRDGIRLEGSGDPRMHQDILHPGRITLESSLAELQKRAAEARAVARQAAATNASPDILSQISEAEADATAWEQEAGQLQQALAAKSTVIGKVIASSGVNVCRTAGCEFATTGQASADCRSNHHLRDVAVIRLRPGLLRPNLGPPASWVKSEGKRPMTRWAEVQPGEKVYKHGATTGTTVGAVYEEATIRREDPFLPDLNGYETGKTIVANCWKVLSAGEGRAFCSGGDSASAVSNNFHQIVGQLHSAFDNGRDTPLSFMAASSTILEGVEEILGPDYEVLLPSFEDGNSSSPSLKKSACSIM
ncbi:MAG: hypothetical protein Q9196_006652 [Gyalolechia fulgens]